MIHLCMFYLREHGNHNICVSYNKRCFILRGFSVYHLNNSIACVLLYQYIFVSAGRLLHMWLIRDMCCALHTHTCYCHYWNSVHCAASSTLSMQPGCIYLYIYLSAGWLLHGCLIRGMCSALHTCYCSKRRLEPGVFAINGKHNNCWF